VGEWETGRRGDGETGRRGDWEIGWKGDGKMIFEMGLNHVREAVELLNHFLLRITINFQS